MTLNQLIIKTGLYFILILILTGFLIKKLNHLWEYAFNLAFLSEIIRAEENNNQSLLPEIK